MVNSDLQYMNDGNFTFWNITNGSIEVIFRVRKDVGNDNNAALKRAKEKQLLGTGVFPRGCGLWTKLATEAQIKEWMDKHPDYAFVEKTAKVSRPPKNYVPPKPSEIPFFRGL